MSGEHSALDKSMEDILMDLMAERVMSVGIQALSTRGLKSSPSTAHCSSRTATKKGSKHHNDMANVKKIVLDLPYFILPLVGIVGCDNISRDFEYTLITTYILKGICIVGPQLGQIPALKNNEFNFRDRRNYVMLAPHWYLMKTTRKNLCIVSQLWIKELT
jgi:hypothetical protein